MVNIEKKLRKYLKNRKYNEQLIEQTIEDVKNMDEEVYEAVSIYLLEGEIYNLSCDNVFDTVTLMEIYGMDPIVAYIMVDFYHKDKNEALKCLALGIDYFIPNEELNT